MQGEINFDATFCETSIRHDQTEWHNLSERFTRAPGGSSRWPTDGGELAGLPTGCFSAAGRPLAPSAGPLILSDYFQSQPWPGDPTPVPQSPAHNDAEKMPSLQRKEGKKEGRVKAGEQKVGGSISAGSWRCDLRQRDIPRHDFPATGLLLGIHWAPTVSMPRLDLLCSTFAPCPPSFMLHFFPSFLSLRCFCIPAHFIPLLRLYSWKSPNRVRHLSYMFFRRLQPSCSW